MARQAGRSPSRKSNASKVSGRPAGKELIAVDEIEQRHWLAAQGMNDMAIINDMAMFAVSARRPRRNVKMCVAPWKQSSRSS